MNRDPHGAIAEGNSFWTAPDRDIHNVVRLRIDSRDGAVQTVRYPDRASAHGNVRRSVPDRNDCRWSSLYIDLGHLVAGPVRRPGRAFTYRDLAGREP